MKAPTFHYLALLILSTLGLSACSTEPNDMTDASDATPVRVSAVRIGAAAAPINTRGKVAAAKEMQLSFKTGGFIARITVGEGERVSRGQLLAELALDEIEAQSAQADALAAKAQRDLQRMERLYADEVVSLEALQNARTQAEIAESARAATDFNLRYSRIIAPRDGLILRRFKEERELVVPGQPVVALGADSEGYVIRAALSDRELVQVAIGDSAQIELDAYPNRTLNGQVREIAGAADSLTGLFPIEISLMDSDLRLSSGLVAKVQLQPLSASEGRKIYVPIAAVVEGVGRIAHVFVREGDIARKQRVEIDFIVNEEAALLDGIDGQREVITEGALYLQDGERIRVLESD
jgi:multidrug efflux system membrane fusion protein